MTIKKKIEPNYEPLPPIVEDFLPTQDEANQAFALEMELQSCGRAVRENLKRMAEILLLFFENVRLCKARGFDSFWEWIRDTEVAASLPSGPMGDRWVYRQLALARVDRKFPTAEVFDQPHLTNITHTAAIAQLEALAPGEEGKAIEILEKARTSTIEQLNSEPVPELTVDEKRKLVKLDGVTVLKVRSWSPLTIRAISLMMHLSPPPGFDFRDRQLIGWLNNHSEVIGDVQTDDDALIEPLRGRLHAKRTN